MSTAKTTDKDFKQIWSNITTNYSHWLSFILLMIVAVIINPSFLSVTKPDEPVCAGRDCRYLRDGNEPCHFGRND